MTTERAPARPALRTNQEADQEPWTGAIGKPDLLKRHKVLVEKINSLSVPPEGKLALFVSKLWQRRSGKDNARLRTRH